MSKNPIPPLLGGYETYSLIQLTDNTIPDFVFLLLVLSLFPISYSPSQALSFFTPSQELMANILAWRPQLAIFNRAGTGFVRRSLTRISATTM